MDRKKRQVPFDLAQGRRSTTLRFDRDDNFARKSIKSQHRLRDANRSSAVYPIQAVFWLEWDNTALDR
jgi:hypothetical protein